MDNSQLRWALATPTTNKAAVQLRGCGLCWVPVSAKHKGTSQARIQSQSTCPVPQQLWTWGWVGMGTAIFSSVTVLTAGVARNPIHPATAAPAGVSRALQNGGKRSGQGRQWPMIFHHTKNTPGPASKRALGLSSLMEAITKAFLGTQLHGLNLSPPRPRAGKELMDLCIFWKGQDTAA